MFPDLRSGAALALIAATSAAPAHDDHAEADRAEADREREPPARIERYCTALRASLALTPTAVPSGAPGRAGRTGPLGTGDGGEAVRETRSAADGGEDEGSSETTPAEPVARPTRADPAPRRDAERQARVVDADLRALSSNGMDYAAGRDGEIERATALERMGGAVDARRTGRLWRPVPGTSWQWQLSGEIDTSVEAQVYDIDLFDTPVATIEGLHAAGRDVVCYFSAGSLEDWRPDANRFPDGIAGKALDGWPGERWLDVGRIDALTPVMRARLDLATEKGCDAVEPDNVDVHTQGSGFDVTADEMLAYLRWLSDEAHARGLSIALKNNVGQAAELEPWFDFAVNESCTEYDECGELAPFTAAGKAVFGVSYTDASACAVPNAMNYDWLIKRRELGTWRLACR